MVPCSMIDNIPAESFAVAPFRASIAPCLSRLAGGSLVAVCAVLGWRRLAGVLDRPLQTGVMVTVAVLMALAALLARRAWTRTANGAFRSPPLDRAAGLIISVAVVAAAAALSVPGTPPAGLILFWSILIAEEAWTWWPVRGRRRNGEAAPSAGADTVNRHLALAGATDAPRPSPEQLSPEVLQQLVRTRAADGRETVSGWLRVPLAPGQRTASVHVAFCPPLTQAPRTIVEQVEGPEATVKSVQVQPFGARFDVKLVREEQEPASVLLEFFAEEGTGNQE